MQTTLDPEAAAAVSADLTEPTPAPERLREWLSRLGPFVALALVVLTFTILSDTPARFLSPFNLRIVLSQTVIVAVGAVGMTAIIVSGGIDLSVGGIIALSGVVTALLLRSGLAPVTAVLAGIVAGGAVGLLNGLIVTRMKVVPFIATLGTMEIARGAAKWLAHEQTVNTPETWVGSLLVTFPTPSWLIVSPGVWTALGLAVLAAAVLRGTVFGRRIFALGSNEAAARACGIDTDRLKLWIYGLSGLLFGLSGVFQLSRLRQGDPTVAVGIELDIIAAVVIGGASLFGGEGSILGSIVGALIMAFLRNGCQQMGWPNYVQEIMIGSIIVLAVAFDRWRTGRAA
ncbi:MAG TPA: ABC transporter permease [Longimicrobiaceae bacterium]|nr:ABC transporter permease [Longimicrobiaceae bacterium]